MSSETHNTKAGKEQFGSSGNNPARQQQQAQDPQHSPQHSGARDRENRKGGSNEKNL